MVVREKRRIEREKTKTRREKIPSRVAKRGVKSVRTFERRG